VKPRPPIPEGPYLIVGLARSGIAAALALRARGARVVGVDRGTPSEARALAARGVELHLQGDGLAQLGAVRTVIKSPGVPAQAPVVAAARAAGQAVLGELELAWRLLANEFIAVTGTNGKTTTVHWIGHIHREAGLPVAVAGNVGDALSGLVGRVAPDVTIVCEASSFQLEDTLAFAPEAAVLLNITPDHLDRHGTLAAYRDAKLRIFARQDAGDLAVLGSEVHDVPTAAGVRRVRCGASAASSSAAPSSAAPSPTVSSRTVSLPAAPLPTASSPAAPLPAAEGTTAVDTGGSAEVDCALHDGRLWWEGRPLLAADELRLRGAHNLQNALAAAAVCLARGIDPDAVRAGLRSFTGVAHRLEEVVRRDGVLYVNDSKATNVASTLVALAAFEGRRGRGEARRAAGASEASPSARGAVHLILGGQGKGQDFAAMREPIAAACRGVYLIGEDAELIARALAGVDVRLDNCRELERAVIAARAAAAPGEVVLLSPACASFDQFTDYEARGERFREIVSR
jgi:UDP-N-acetylmuramoylalanine--D-glutamate ligase